MVKLKDIIRTITIGHIDIPVGPYRGFRWPIGFVLPIDPDGMWVRQWKYQSPVQSSLEHLSGLRLIGPRFIHKIATIHYIKYIFPSLVMEGKSVPPRISGSPIIQ